mmetsp:Transcript_922/g.3859  ORF Transcript_922/g.3859 Transcript_922/m.3859 type:complete len:289 (+) Transcript_922:3152-4018(+)
MLELEIERVKSLSSNTQSPTPIVVRFSRVSTVRRRQLVHLRRIFRVARGELRRTPNHFRFFFIALRTPSQVRPIERIGYNRQACMRQVHANLMRSTCQRRHANERGDGGRRSSRRRCHRRHPFWRRHRGHAFVLDIEQRSTRTSDDFARRSRVFSFSAEINRARFLHDSVVTDGRVYDEAVVAIRRHDTHRHGQVRLLRRLLLKLSRYIRHQVLLLHEHGHARGVHIESMHDVRRRPVHMVQRPRQQRIPLKSMIRMKPQIRRFIHHQKLIILKHHVQRRLVSHQFNR